jgi:uncharacterized protein (TIGR03435 family)
MKNCILAVVIAIPAMHAVQAQSTAPQPQFEVASIKPNKSCVNAGGYGPTPGRLDLRCTTLQDLIQLAYVVFASGTSPSIRHVPISGAPRWVDSEYYDVLAKAEGNAPFAEMAGPMLRALLAERFQLKLHRETREAPVYALTVAKGGLKIKPTKEGDCVPVDLNHPSPPATRGDARLILCGSQSVEVTAGRLVVEINGASLKDIASGVVSDQLGRPIVDKTGLTGLFDVHLEFAPDLSATPQVASRGVPVEPGNSPSATDSGVPSIFTAMVEQLGLKLESAKGPVDVIVIDRAERPSEN